MKRNMEKAKYKKKSVSEKLYDEGVNFETQHAERRSCTETIHMA